MTITEDIRDRIKRELTPGLYDEIRDLWKAHSIAEDARDIPGLIATLAPDCVYEVPQVGAVWRGHDGATKFYTELLTAFPDVHFDLQDIVIGPQGVFEVANVTGTFKTDWLRFKATGGPVEFQVMIHFPWNPAARKFSGERVYIDRPQLFEEA